MLKSRKCWISSTFIKLVSKLGFLYQNFTSTVHTSCCSLVVLGLNTFLSIQNPSPNQDLRILKFKINFYKLYQNLVFVLKWYWADSLRNSPNLKLKFDIKIGSCIENGIEMSCDTHVWPSTFSLFVFLLYFFFLFFFPPQFTIAPWG